MVTSYHNTAKTHITLSILLPSQKPKSTNSRAYLDSTNEVSAEGKEIRWHHHNSVPLINQGTVRNFAATFNSGIITVLTAPCCKRTTLMGWEWNIW
jgi:hypothetical protein